MTRRAPADHPIHPLIAERWSPRAFSPRPVSPETVRTLLEAARWAPSAYNGQPWRFIVATRDDPEGFAKASACLNPFNRAWASAAPVLLLSLARLNFESGKPNRHARHDLGLAVAQLTIQASHEGLGVHQMAGILPEVVIETYGVPEGFEPVTGLAIGYPGDPDTLSEGLAAKERAPRERLPMEAFAFSNTWGDAF